MANTPILQAFQYDKQHFADSGRIRFGCAGAVALLRL
jgi:hypothetical protein